MPGDPALKDPTMARSPARQRLREIILKQSVLERGNFTLASGRTSAVFFDMKKTMLDPEGANLVADAFLDLLVNEKVDAIGGLAMGAVPIVAAVCVKSYPKQPLRGFFVCKEAKDHGTQRLIDGHLEDGLDVVLLEDVTTTGGSVLKAIEAVRSRGCRVSKVMTIVDRLEGASENLRKEGVELVALFTRTDFTA